jgi:cysteine desulfurase/selenocysteine lyase
MKEFFPALSSSPSLIYFDNAATTQKPEKVIQRLHQIVNSPCANVARGVHTLGQTITEEFEAVRDQVRNFIGAHSSLEIVFTSGVTESINLVASSWGRISLEPGDVILCSTMEHHANIVPWQQIAEQRGALVLPIPLDENLDLDLAQFELLLQQHPVKMVALVHLSNALGVVNPVKRCAQLAHQYGACILVDGAQALANGAVDVVDLDADFYVFGSHKMYGPCGVGVLYGKQQHLDRMPPYNTGGGMIAEVSFDGSSFADTPMRFEAGTPNIEGVLSFGAAIEFVSELHSNSTLMAQQEELFKQAQQLLTSFPEITIHGIDAQQRAAILSFSFCGVHAHDLGSVLDSFGIAVRSGHHCCMPLMTHLGVSATTRISFACYNELEELKVLQSALLKTREVFSA